MDHYKNVELYRELHNADNDYGSSSITYIDELSVIIDFLKPKSILDFGCGKGALIEALKKRYPNIAVYGFDPAISGRDVLPVQRADLVINTDVLEHIPENELPSVINQIHEISENVYFVLHHALADGILPNGENLHCTVKSNCWYQNFLGKYFSCITCLDSDSIWKSTIVTFPIDIHTWMKHDSFVKKRRIHFFIDRFFTFHAPIRYKIFQPIMWLMKKVIKLQCIYK